jgi:hypothetical protein
VSLWQLHGDLEGTFHRVGYIEDEVAHLALNKLDQIFSPTLHDIDKIVSDAVYKSI